VDIRYAWLDGNYAPLVQVRALDEMGYPSDQTASISGTLTNEAVVNLAAEDGQLLLVSVIGNPIDYLFDDVEATFEIGLAG
jgi:hypothetical protein